MLPHNQQGLVVVAGYKGHLEVQLLHTLECNLSGLERFFPNYFPDGNQILITRQSGCAFCVALRDEIHVYVIIKYKKAMISSLINMLVVIVIKFFPFIPRRTCMPVLSFKHISVLIGLIFVTVCCGTVMAGDNDGFSFATPMPTGNTIHDSWSVDGETFFFVGDGGTILKYHNGSWEFMDTPTDSALLGIHGTSINDIWAVGGEAYGEADGEKSVVLHYNGTSWSSVAPPDYMGMGDFHVMIDVFAAASDDVWAVAASSSYLCHYNGSTWSFVDTGILTTLPYDFYAIHGYSANDIYAVGACNTIIHYDGSSWSKEHQVESCDPNMTLNLLYDVWGTAVDSVYTCGNGGQILVRNALPAAGWTQIHEHGGILYGTNLNAVGGEADGAMFFVGNEGVIWKYEGAAFTTVPVGSPSSFHTIINRSSGGYIIGGTQGTANGFDGTNQIQLTTPVSLNKDFALTSYDGNKLWLSPAVLTDAQGIYTYKGRSFSEHQLSFGSGNQAQAITLKAFAEDDVWLSTQINLGVIKRYNGSTWTDYTPPGRIDHPILLDVLKASSGNYFAVLTNADGSGRQQVCKILESTTECFSDSSGFDMYFSLTEAEDGTIYAAGNRGKIVSYANGNWTEEVTGLDVNTNLTGIAAGGGWVYAAGTDRTVICKQSGGSWQPVGGLTPRTGNSFSEVVYGGNGISYAVLTTPSQYRGGGKGYIYALQNGTATRETGGSSMSFNGLSTNGDGMTVAAGNGGILFGIGLHDFLIPSLAEAIKILQILSNSAAVDNNYLDLTNDNKADIGDVISILQAHVQ